jgi:hypothetical protein
MKKPLFTIAFLVYLLFTFSQTVYTQNYKNAIGLRAGAFSGITYKQFINQKNAFEIYGLLRFYNTYNTTNFTGVYQVHNAIPNVSALKWYYGFGATLGFNGYKNTYRGNKISGINVGILGTAGLDLALKDIPICLSLDWSPTFFLNNGGGFYGDYAHFAIRYILGR